MLNLSCWRTNTVPKVPAASTYLYFLDIDHNNSEVNTWAFLINQYFEKQKFRIIHEIEYIATQFIQNQ